MILGVGIDIVKVDRFKKWEYFSPEQLNRVFFASEVEEIDKKNPGFATFLASRFAVKEAFFKALSSTLVTLGMTEYEFTLLFLCKCVRVVKKKWDVPMLQVNWDLIEEKIKRKLPLLKVALSLSHERDYAVAYVVICIEQGQIGENGE